MTLQLAYLGLTLGINLILLIIGFKSIGMSFPKTVAIRKKRLLFIGLMVWQLYIYLMASSGFLQNFEFPPRFVLFLILPAFVFTGVFLYKNRLNQWILKIPKSWLIYYQTFRIAIETIFVFSVAQGVLHKEVTIEGYNFDLIYAFTAPIIAFLAFQKKTLSKKVVLLWNYIGLTVIASIIFLFISTTYLPHLYGSDHMLLPKAMVTYPYILVAGFLMPSAVFIHILSIIQLRRGLKRND